MFSRKCFHNATMIQSHSCHYCQSPGSASAEMDKYCPGTHPNLITLQHGSNGQKRTMQSPSNRRTRTLHKKKSGKSSAPCFTLVSIPYRPSSVHAGNSRGNSLYNNAVAGNPAKSSLWVHSQRWTHHPHCPHLHHCHVHQHHHHHQDGQAATIDILLMAFLDILDRMIYFRICLCLITILNENFGIHAKWSFLELRSHQRMPAFSHWTGHWTQSGRLRDTETASSKSTAYPDTGRRAHSYIHVLITKTIQTHRNLFYNKESWSTIMTRRKLVQQERNDQDVKILLTSTSRHFSSTSEVCFSYFPLPRFILKIFSLESHTLALASNMFWASILH